MSLPKEIMLKIVESANRNSIASLCTAVGNLTVEEAHYHKNNPRVFFQRLTNNPDKLLKAMQESNTILSGSRAASYFYDNACLEDSDYDFYGSGGLIGTSIFISRMSDIGTKWNTESINPGVGVADDFYSAFHILRGTLNGNKVQFMWSNDRSAFSHIIKFHSTIVQCLVSSTCAISMYHHISSKNQFIEWTHEWVPGQATARERTGTHHKCISKYIGRGFQKIPYNAMHIGSYPDSVYAAAKTRNRTRMFARSLSDNGCKIVDFLPYMNYADLSDEVVVHKSTIEYIHSIKWTERNRYPSLNYQSNILSWNERLYFIRMNLEPNLWSISVSGEDNAVDKRIILYNMRSKVESDVSFLHTIYSSVSSRGLCPVSDSISAYSPL